MSASPNIAPLRRLRKPSAETRFHIDYQWWEQSVEDLSIYQRRLLPSDLRANLSPAESDDGTICDWVHPETGRVRRLDALQSALREASLRPDFINTEVSLVDLLFRILLANDHEPLSVAQLAARSGRPATTILKTIGGRRVYKGIRPID